MFRKCETCDQLLQTYAAAARRYSDASRKLAGALGADFLRVWEECGRLRGACGAANEALLTHLKSHLAENGSEL